MYFLTSEFPLDSDVVSAASFKYAVGARFGLAELRNSRSRIFFLGGKDIEDFMRVRVDFGCSVFWFLVLKFRPVIF